MSTPPPRSASAAPGGPRSNPRRPPPPHHPPLLPAFAKSSEILVATAKLMATNLVLILGSELLLTRGLLPLSHAYGAWLYAAAGSS